MTNFVYNNFGNTTLAAPLSSSATTLILASAANFPTSIPGGFVLAIILNDAATEKIYEIVYATAISGTTVSGLLRGQEGTTPQNWNVGDLAYTGPTAAMFASVAPNVGATGSANGLVVKSTSGTQISVTANSASLITTGGSPLYVAPVSVSINAATNGANGLDTGSLAANTIYNVFLISNGSGVAGLLSLSATAPVTPAGYNLKYRVGSLPTNGASQFYAMEGIGDAWSFIVGGFNTSNLPPLIQGVAGSVSVPTWAPASTSLLVPPTAKSIRLVLFAGSVAVSIAAPNNSYGAFNSSSNPPPLLADTISGQGGTSYGEFVPESANVYYAAETSACGLFCAGYRDNLSS